MADRSASTRIRFVAGQVVRGPAPATGARIVPQFNRLGISDVLGPGGVRRHRHAGYEAILVDEGSYACRINDQRLELRPGEGLLLQPGDWHEDIFAAPLRYFGLMFKLTGEPLDYTPPSIFAPGVRPAEQCFRVHPERSWPLIRALQREGEKPDQVSGNIQDALVLALFWQIVRDLPPAAVNPEFLTLSGDQAFPTQLLRLFRLHVDRDLSVAEMAEKLNLSESTLAHKCTSLLGVPPRKAFLKCKMERAQYLLRNSAFSVKEVAAELGFADPFVFSRTFKNVCGVSPAYWKSQNP